MKELLVDLIDASAAKNPKLMLRRLALDSSGQGGPGVLVHVMGS